MRNQASLLFLLILILFCGCRKAEKKIAGPVKVHEINIGILGVKRDSISFKLDYGIHYFWHLDLLNDSIYFKEDPVYFGSPEKQIVKAGKLALKNDSVILKFLSEVKTFKNGQQFLYQFEGPESYVLYCLQYQEDSISKVIAFNDFTDPRSNFKELAELLVRLGFKTKLDTVYSKLFRENSKLLQQFLAVSPDSLLPPPPVQKTIKFTPPVKTNETED